MINECHKNLNPTLMSSLKYSTEVIVYDEGILIVRLSNFTELFNFIR